MTAPRIVSRHAIQREQFPPFTTLYKDGDEVHVRGLGWRRIAEQLIDGKLQLGNRNNLPVRRATGGL